MRDITNLRVQMRQREEEVENLRKEKDEIVRIEHEVRRLENNWEALLVRKDRITGTIEKIQNFPSATRLARRVNNSFSHRAHARVDDTFKRMRANIIQQYDMNDENLKNNSKKIRELRDELREELRVHKEIGSKKKS